MPRRPTKPPVLPEHVVAHPAELAACLDHLAARQARSRSTPSSSAKTPTAPTSASSRSRPPERLFVIDPFACGPLDAFWELLLDPARTVVVHAGREDLRICHFAVGRPPAKRVRRADRRRAGRVQLPDRVRRARAGPARPADDEGRDADRLAAAAAVAGQMRYAFDDVRYLLPAWQEAVRPAASGSTATAWADEEFAGVRPPGRGRRRDGRAVAEDEGHRRRSTAAGWRSPARCTPGGSGSPARVNRPPRTLLRDDLIVEIARRRRPGPTTCRASAGCRAARPEAILEAVRRAKALPPDECPEVEARENDPANVVLLGEPARRRPRRPRRARKKLRREPRRLRCRT